jgi:Ca-activated chloride channel homolog
MLRFQHSEYLWFWVLLIFILAAFIIVMSWKKKIIRKIGDKNLVEQLFAGYSKKFYRLKFIFLFIGFFFLVAGTANLQLGDKMEKITNKGVDVMIAIDVSKSMLAQDVQPSRLDRAKQVVSKLLDNLPDDRIGLVVFAGNAYVQMPLTVDYSAARMYLNTISPDVVPTPGTDIGAAIDRCDQAFGENQMKHKAIILISDGEDFGGTAVQEAEKAYDDGIIINTVGVGTAEGAPIKDPSTGDYKRDASGNIVITKMNPEDLKSIAAAGHGIYQQLENTDQVVKNLADKINAMAKNEYGENIFSNYTSYFQYFLGIALLLLIIEFFIPERKKWTLA